MVEHLIDYLERHGRDVGAHPRRLYGVNRMTNAGGQNFGGPGLITIYLDDVAQQHQTILTDIVEPPDKRADV